MKTLRSACRPTPLSAPVAMSRPPSASAPAAPPAAYAHEWSRRVAGGAGRSATTATCAATMVSVFASFMISHLRRHRLQREGEAQVRDAEQHVDDEVERAGTAAAQHAHDAHHDDQEEGTGHDGRDVRLGHEAHEVDERLLVLAVLPHEALRLRGEVELEVAAARD